MTITCTNCRTRYVVADELIKGKLIRIRCKRCFTTNVAIGPRREPEKKAA